MTVTVEVPEPLAGRLAAEAARRGVSVEVVAVEALEGVYGSLEPTEGDDSLLAFIGCGSSGRSDPFEIAQARSDLAARKLAVSSPTRPSVRRWRGPDPVAEL